MLQVEKAVGNGGNIALYRSGIFSVISVNCRVFSCWGVQKFEKSRFLGFLLPKGKLETSASKHLLLSGAISSLEGTRGGAYVLLE